MSSPFERLRQVLTASLGRRLAFNLLGFGLLGLAAILLLLGAVIEHRFSSLERKEIEGHVDRSKAALEQLQDTMEARSLDWAIWDDSFEYLHSPNTVYEADNINLSSFENIDTAAMGFVRFDGGFRKAAYYDFATGEEDPAAREEFLRRIAAPRFAASMAELPLRQGFMRIGSHVLVIAAAQIYRSDNSGTPEGYMVMAKELRDEDLVQALQLPARLDLAAGRNVQEITQTGSEVSIAERIGGLDGETVGTIRFAVPRALKQEGTALLAITAGGVTALLIGLVILLNWRLGAVLIRPIEAFQGHVSRISSSGELGRFQADDRNDELGALYREFNGMADELNSLRAKVEAQSFAIGQSESAIAIMHNVRNAISPVQAILSKLEQRLHFPAAENVTRAMQELTDDAPAAGRQRQLLAFVDTAMNEARHQLADHRGDLRAALRAVGQVVETISSANEQVPDREAVECDLSTVIGSSAALVRHSEAAEISIEFTADERFRVAVPRVILAQIIDNLLTNSAEAIAATGRGRGSITVHAGHKDGAAHQLVHITIRDDGDGFAAEHALDLFERGKSSRAKKSGGIGLHWCANTLNALGGSIAIESGGMGTGATVELALPLAGSGQADAGEPAHSRDA